MPDAELLHILKLLRAEIERIGNDTSYVFAQFDAGHLCAAETIIETAVNDKDALAALHTEQANQRLLKALVEKSS